jgi:hypothetical protein
MGSILYRMPSGIPGDISRSSASDVESVILNASLPFSAFGLVGKKVGGKFVPFAGAETIADVAGFLVRPYPTTGADAAGAVPPAAGIGNVLRRGFMTVKSNAGTPAADGTVYVRVAAATGGKPLGGIEAVADSTNTFILTNAKFKSAADANGNVEIEFNI